MSELIQTGYLRVSLTNACNLRCFYCRPESAAGNKNTRIIDFGKLKQAIEFFYKIGVKKVRFTGGEPILYSHLTDLISSTKVIDESIHIALTTNGILLTKNIKEYAAAGLDSVNISLDTINEGKFETITGKNKLKSVIRGIKLAIKCVPEVKLNCVLIKGINDGEVKELIDFANNLGIDIRFIEYMPSKSDPIDKTKYISSDEIISLLPYSLYPLAGIPSTAANYYKSPHFDNRVGFISPVSHPFCSYCNRIRLDSHGDLYGCLFSGHSIKLFNILNENEQMIADEVLSFLKDKKYSGYHGALKSENSLPSFINMGG